MNTFQQLAIKAIRLLILFALMIFFVFNSIHKAYAEETLDKLLILKAAMIVKFIKYTHWPQQAHAKENNVANLCILKSPQLFSALKVIEGKVIRGKKLALKQVSDNDVGQTACHVLFLGEYNTNMLNALAKIEQAILTISDQSGFAADNGMIELTTRKTHLSFNINLTQLKRVKLKINSAVLELAKQVYK